MRLKTIWKTFWGYFPVSLTGAVVLVLCGLGFWYLGVVRGDYLLLLAAVATAGVVLVMVLAAAGGAILTQRRWREAVFPDSILRLEAGRPGWTGLRLKPPRLPFVEVTWSWVDPPGVEVRAATGQEEVHPSRRCRVDRVVRRFAVKDVLGMASLTWIRERPTRVRVLPDMGVLDRISLLTSAVGGEEVSDPFGEPRGDRVEMRRYAPGDPLRMILWKVYARNRKLMVRTPEKAVSARPRTCAYLVADSSDEASAALARVVLQRGLLGEGWRFGADGSSERAERLDEALDLLARSGNPGAKSPGLGAFLEEARADGFQGCLVFVPPVPGPWLEPVQRAAARSPLHLTFLAAADRLSTARRERWRDILYLPGEEQIDPRPLLEALDPVILFDRRRGTALSSRPRREMVAT